MADMATGATGAESPTQSVRERNRRDPTRVIVAEARRQSAADGAAGLSLRSVARELAVASSAIHRYVAGRDERRTLLIVDAYHASGSAVERSAARAASRGPDERFRAFAIALRRWAPAHRHEYALIYGSPAAGGRGTAEKTRAAARSTTVLAGLVRDAANPAATVADSEPPRVLWSELTRLLATPVFAGADGKPAPIPRPVLVRGLLAWTELLGLISIELFGQFAIALERTEQLYLHAVNVIVADLF